MTLGWGIANTVISVGIGAVAGVLLFAWRARVIDRNSKRIPKRWPLHSRVMANTEECRVWGWLGRVFYDHHIMIKTPVTRFTVPQSREQGQNWYQLLSGVYCTFTVCSADGRVVGCVDVQRKNGISRSNRQLKTSLLSQCGIAYCVVESRDLPTMEEIRDEFLGECTDSVPDTVSQSPISLAREKLRVALDRQRHSRGIPLDTPSAFRAESEFAESEFDVGAWQQQHNSFIAPLDSRKADLR